MYPQISVIVPVYNTEKYLEHCLNTIVNQTFQDIEIILVNDGSTDDSFNIIEKFAKEDERIIIIHREKSSGSAAVPRNMGLDTAKGKYVMFLDSDDYFDLTMLEKLYNRAEAVSAELVICDHYGVRNNGNIDAGWDLNFNCLPDKETFSYKDIPDVIFQVSSGAPWNKLISREFLENECLRFQSGVPILDDVYFTTLLLVLASRISVVNEKLVFYCLIRQDSQTSNRDIVIYEEPVFKSFYAINNTLKERGIYDAVKKSFHKALLGRMLYWLCDVYKYQSYVYLFESYRNKYLDKFGLADVDLSLLDCRLVDFYRTLNNKEFVPPLKFILESELTPGSNIAIYGAGNVGKRIHSLVTDYGKHNVALWCDKNADNLDNPLVSMPETLLSQPLDAVIIAIKSTRIVQEVWQYLLKLGIDNKKIYWISEY